MSETPDAMLITGTRSGVGRLLAEWYLARGHTVFGCSRGECDLAHERYTHFTLDIADEEAVKQMFAAIAATRIPLARLINNAGISQSKLALLTGAAEVKRVLETNLLGTFIASREAIKLMKKARFGRIINFSSINVPLASIGSAMYNASKAGVESLATTLARECVGDDITLNTIGLSLVEHSGMAEGLSEKALKEKQSALIKPAPLQIAEIAQLIDYFSSPLAKNVTGQTVYFGGVR